MKKREVKLKIIDTRECIPDDASVVFEHNWKLTTKSKEALLLEVAPQMMLAVSNHSSAVSEILKKFADNASEYNRAYEVTDFDSLQADFEIRQFNGGGVSSSSMAIGMGSIAIGNGAMA